MSKAPTTPAPPPLSAEETALLQKQGLTLDQFLSAISDQRSQSQETQDLLKNLSGLYDEKVTPGSTIAGTESKSANKTKWQSDQGAKLSAIISEAKQSDQPQNVQDLVDAISRRAPDAGLSSDVVSGFADYANKNPGRGGVFDPTRIFRDFDAQVKNSPDDLIRYGAYDSTKTPDQVIAEKKDWVLNQDKLADLRKRIEANVQYEQGLQGSINDINSQLIDRAGKALRGELPIPEATKQAKLKEFQDFKAAANRSGLQIFGDNLETSSAGSTNGNQLLSQLKSKYKAIEDAQARGEIDSSLANFGQGLGFRSYPSYSAPSELNYVTSASQYGPASLFGAYGAATQGLGFATQPYQNQRNMQYQADIQNSANRNAFTNSLINAGTTLGSAYLFGPASLGFGAARGTQIAAGQGGSNAIPLPGRPGGTWFQNY